MASTSCGGLIGRSARPTGKGSRNWGKGERVARNSCLWKQHGLTVAWLALTFLGIPGEANAAGFTQFVAFGDSNIDSGYFRYNSTGSAALDAAIASSVAQGASGAFVGPGVMNSTMLARRFGLNAAPVGNGGTNYANGGAHTVSDVLPNVPTIQWIKQYLSSVNGTANPHGLYEVRTGDNDLAYVKNQGEVWLAANPNYLDGIASTLATNVAALQAAGARTILVPNSYNCAVFAGPGGDIASDNAAAYARSFSFDANIWSNLTAAGVNFIPADIDSVFRFVIKQPALFGFTATSVLSANAPSPTSALLTTTAMISPAQERTYLFVDPVHLTTAGQQIESDYEYSLLTSPSQISLVAESAVQGGLARVAALQRQIELSGPPTRSNRLEYWVITGANNLRMENAPGFPKNSGFRYDSTVGMDYQTPAGVIVGAALSAGNQTQRFSTGGKFSQNDEAPSLYVCYNTGRIWGNALATYGLFQDRILRQVPLGTFTDENRADPNGHSVALALRGGRDFSFGRITAGPLAGMMQQRLHLDGFTETGLSGVSAMSFLSQTRNSLVSQLGWRCAAGAGKWQLFADVAWNREWAEKNRAITASLKSVAVVSYTTEAVPVASDWITASLSTCYKLNSRMGLRGAVSVVLGNPRVTSYGGEFGLSAGF